MFSPKPTEKKFQPTGLFTPNGQRKYLDAHERNRFIVVANRQAKQIKLLCLVLVLTGCRLTEALNLTREHVSLNEGVVVIRSLKKRGKISFRQVPLPTRVLRELHFAKPKNTNRRIFKWGRTQALHHVKAVMVEAGITEFLATARALRHTFGVHAVLSNVPLNLVQRWLGHADIETTAIYTNILGSEERIIAKRMWTQ